MNSMHKDSEEAKKFTISTASGKMPLKFSGSRY
jgi:hypothetical protein